MLCNESHGDGVILSLKGVFCIFVTKFNNCAAIILDYGGRHLVFKKTGEQEVIVCGLRRYDRNGVYVSGVDLSVIC